MVTTDLTDANYLLSKLLMIEGSNLVISHPWIWEEERWKELVFALLTRIIDLPKDRVRDLVNCLADLNLLDITTLAKLCRDRTNFDFSNSHARRILEVLHEGGASEADAQTGLASIAEAALGLEEHYNGKVQDYLRCYGELMVREVEQTFRFSTLNKAEVKRAFTYWLQSVLNMPLPLADEHIEACCKENHLTPEELFAAADQLNMNVALLGDLAQRHTQLQRQRAVQRAERSTAPRCLVSA